MPLKRNLFESSPIGQGPNSISKGVLCLAEVNVVVSNPFEADGLFFLFLHLTEKCDVNFSGC